MAQPPAEQDAQSKMSSARTEAEDVQPAAITAEKTPEESQDSMEREKALAQQQQPESIAAEPPKKQGVQANDLSAIPNGGTKAWLQAVGSFFLFFNTW
jgi:hypothetical protein